jgi:hypothetical protein
MLRDILRNIPHLIYFIQGTHKNNSVLINLGSWQWSTQSPNTHVILGHAITYTAVSDSGQQPLAISLFSFKVTTYIYRYIGVCVCVSVLL